MNYIEHLIILTSTVTGCISILAFASLVVIHTGFKSSAIGLTFFAIIVGIKKHKSVIKKKRKTTIKNFHYQNLT